MTKVYLDHLLPRESFRYVDQRTRSGDISDSLKKTDIRLRDIDEDDWFERLRKPDFQRETNSWTPQSCVSLLTSLVNKDVIPGVICWKDTSSTLIYIIDGAHRLSVIRAWIKDDWGDNHIDYYNEGNREEIGLAAQETRDLVLATIGSYAEFVESAKQLRLHLRDGVSAPKLVMAERDFQQAQFYAELRDGASLIAQWVNGTYQEAERSFLQINRSGERLSPFEQMLIEFRNSPYARVVSSIVSAGRVGHFWPESGLSDESKRRVEAFPGFAKAIHGILFQPPSKGEIVDLNQPLVISKPGDRYEDCLDLAALVADNIFLIDDAAKRKILEHNNLSESQDVIARSEEIFRLLLDRLSQLIGESTNPKSIGISPLIYTYNHHGNYSKNLLYGFLFWMFSGTDDAVRTKKLALSAVRGRFEAVLSSCKSDITGLARAGGGFKTTKAIAEAINDIIYLLLENTKSTDSEAVQSVILNLNYNAENSRILTSGRGASGKQRNQINIESILTGSVRCSICGGILNLRSGKQYDHFFETFAKVRETSTDNMKPTHPFCNNMRERIYSIKSGKEVIKLPQIVSSDNLITNLQARQLTLF